MSFHCVRCHAEIDRSFKACPHCGEPVTDFLREYADKPVDGKYRIIERLGTGGMGEVYKVEHTFLGATRVIKVIRPQISGTDDAHDRFLREARLATKVQHANVATLHDFSALPDGSHYMVWEFIEGENLAQLLRFRGTLPPRYAVQLIRQALAGMEAIHRAGIVHRDISPENVMLTRAENGEERVKVIDLGVAKGDETDQSMTKTGMFVGKLRYCSPEHLGFLTEGEKIDGRADLYSLAIVLYEMLAGRAPFEATSPHQYIIHHSREEQLRSIDLNDVPGSAALQSILQRALDRDRNKRYASAREFGDALAAVEPTLPEPGPWEDSEPLDGEPTLRLTPPVASSRRGNLEEATVRTDPSASTPSVRIAPPVTLRSAPTTQRTNITAVAPAVAPPTPLAPPPTPQSRRSAAPLIIAVVVILGLLAVIGALMMRRTGTTPDSSVAPTRTAPAPPMSQPSQTTFDVAASSAAPTTTLTTSAPPTVTAASVA
ncbi:MAG: protein kinase, partial [Thermoanaerobaculia bacterium]